MKIGITERGDAGLDFTWVNKLDTVDGAIIISKRIASKPFKQHLIEESQAKHNLILHATVTFLGGSDIEPNVPRPDESIRALSRLVSNGFDPKRIVFRLDPIMVVEQVRQLELMLPKIIDLGISRVRFSFIDFYKHAKARFAAAEIALPKLAFGGFTLNKETQQKILTKLCELSEKMGFS